MFRGRYEYAIDSKGRISIPSKFKEILNQEYDNRLVITNYDHCLVAYPFQEWSLIEEKVKNLPALSKDARAFFRFFYSSGIDCEIDKHGRLLIPQSLRDYANLQKDVVLVGSGKKIEIWNKERWEEEFRKSQENFDRVADTLSHFGF
ncbi:MAG: division/cell wall cluster transcriptional repressor MraZ [Thermodesulfobacteriota bacterium]|jgi:MraZ protein